MAAGGAGADEESGYVRLISSDDHVFIVERKFAMVSGTIKAMLSGQFSESKGEVRFPEIRAAVLEKVIECVSWATCGSAPNAHTICRYFHFKVKFTNSKVPIPEFPIPPEIALDTMMASNFLAC